MPRRTCVGCRVTAEKAELTRVVFDGERVRLDEAQRLPGRGAYLHPGCLPLALRRRAFSRALRLGPGVPVRLDGRLAALADGGGAGDVT